MGLSKERFERIESYYRQNSQYFKELFQGDEKASLAYPMHIGFHEKGSFPDTQAASVAMNERIVSYCDFEPGQRVLDAGCGTGNLSIHIAENFPNLNIHGIDILPMHLVSSKNKKYNNLSFSLQDYASTAFKEGSFNRIIFLESLGHAENKKEVLSEAYRLLHQSGLLVVADIFINPDAVLDEIERRQFTDFQNRSAISGIQSFSDFQRNLQTLGFKNIEYEDVTDNVVYPPELYPTDSKTSIKDEKLEDILIGVAKILAKHKASYLIVKAWKLDT